MALNDEEEEEGEEKKTKKSRSGIINDDDDEVVDTQRKIQPLRKKRKLDLHSITNSPSPPQKTTTTTQQPMPDESYSRRRVGSNYFTCHLCDPFGLNEISIDAWHTHCLTDAHKLKHKNELQKQRLYGL